MKRITAAFPLIVCLLVFAGCSDKSSSLVGKWIPEVTDGKTVIEFFSDKTAALEASKSENIPAQWVVDGDRIKIDLTFPGATMTWTGSFEKDKLTLNIDKEVVVFVKAK